MSEQPESGEPPAARPRPPFVLGPEAERRWDLCVALATRNTALAGEGPSGLTAADAAWYEARDLFHSDIPTGDPDEPPATLRGEAPT